MTPPRQWERLKPPTGGTPRAAAEVAEPESKTAASSEPAAPRAAKFVIRRAPENSPVPWQAWVALAVVLVFFGWKMIHRADPHYLRAQRLVADFERGKTPEGINYQDPVYDEALDHLRSVSIASGSTAAATTMSNEILDKKKAFARRLKEAQARMDAERDDHAARVEAVLLAQQASTGTDTEAAARLTASASSECKEERHRHVRGESH